MTPTSTTLPFSLPPLEPDGPAPTWHDGGFDVGGERTAILSYGCSDEGWDDFTTDVVAASTGDELAIERASRTVALDDLVPALAPIPHPVVIDIGCFVGHFIRALRLRAPHFTAIAIDSCLNGLEGIAATVPDVPLIQLDILDCPLPSAIADGLVCLNVLEHVRHDERALHTCLRLLKPGGTAVVQVPASPACFDIFDEGLLHFRRYRMADIAATCRAVGFDLVRTTHVGFVPFPAFWLVKRYNRLRYGGLSLDAKRSLIRGMLQSARDSHLLRLALAVDARLGRWCSLPFGIRCHLVLRRPA